MFPMYKLCFQSNSYVSNIQIMFPISDVCFQYTDYVSKRLFMFPISNFCFQYPMHVSNIHFLFPNANDVSKRQCFQCMFPIYIEPHVQLRKVILRRCFTAKHFRTVCANSRELECILKINLPFMKPRDRAIHSQEPHLYHMISMFSFFGNFRMDSN